MFSVGKGTRAHEPPRFASLLQGRSIGELLLYRTVRAWRYLPVILACHYPGLCDKAERLDREASPAGGYCALLHQALCRFCNMIATHS